jgi:hypothetical protein
MRMSHYSIYICRADLEVGLPQFSLLLCPRIPRPPSRPLTLRVTHPMTHQDLWVLHTGSESTKHSRRKLTHLKHLNGKESEYS